MKLGINLMLWTDLLNDRSLRVLQMLKQQGWDGVEVPLLDLTVDYKEWGKRLDELGFRRTASTALGAAHNPISPNPAIRAAGIDLAKRTIDCCRTIGAEILVGPIHSAIGEFTGRGPTAQEWQWSVEAMREVANHAQQAGVTLGLEFLNRFECYLLNHTTEMVRFVQEVNHPSCRMIFDTFHAHIEEKDPLEALKEAAPYLAMVHISENDRGTPGRGQIAWEKLFSKLREIRFNGWLVVEAFGTALPALRAATKIWRPLYESEEQLARDALKLLKSGSGDSK
jgi:D-psicose/D-tagatose/L-ribulose 3-epimerase